MNGAFLPHSLNPIGRSDRFSLVYKTRDFGALQLHTVSYAEEMLVRTPPFESFYCIHFSAAGECEYRQQKGSHVVDSNYVYISGASHAFEQHMSPNYKQVTLKVGKQALERFLASELGKTLDEPLCFETAPVKVNAEVLSFLNQLTNYYQLISGGLFIQGRSHVANNFENAIIAMLFSIFPNNYTQEYYRNTQDLKPYFIRRAEKFIVSNGLDSISLEDIIAASGVSRRSLHHGFRQYLNITPMKYLKMHRLRTVHEILLHGKAEGVTITQIASDCGFTHMGKFSQDYKALFGETPSETLRKSCGSIANSLD